VLVEWCPGLKGIHGWATMTIVSKTCVQREPGESIYLKSVLISRSGRGTVRGETGAFTVRGLRASSSRIAAMEERLRLCSSAST